MDIGLKKGDKLYELIYWSDRTRAWKTYTIKSFRKNRIYLCGGYKWSIPFDEIGDTYFTSKKALIQDKIKRHTRELKELYADDVRPLEKEIRYLQRKLKELKVK